MILGGVRVKTGDDLALGCTVQDAAGAAIDLTGWLITCQIRTHEGSIVADLAVSITDAPGGAYSLSATAAQTAAWQPGSHLADIRYVDAGGSVRHTETFGVSVESAVTA